MGVSLNLLVWGGPFPTNRAKVWEEQGHRVVHLPSPEADPGTEDPISGRYETPDLVMVTDWEDGPDPGGRCRKLAALRVGAVLLHAVARPLAEYGRELHLKELAGAGEGQGETGAPSLWAAWNAWPDALDTPLWELALSREEHRAAFDNLAHQMLQQFVFCPDTGGMISPRILASVINEAYHTIDQGIASRQDIDLGMRYGTNYPFGPLEWSDRIGPVRLLRALDAWQRSDTTGDRYRAATSLREAAAQTTATTATHSSS